MSSGPRRQLQAGRPDAEQPLIEVLPVAGGARKISTHAGHFRYDPSQGEERVSDQGARERFEQLWTAHYPAIYAFVRRRLNDDFAAADVTAGTFLVAWRRLDDVPDRPRPWLFAVARNVLANHRRGEERRAALTDKALAARDMVSEAPPSAHTEDLVAAFNRLSRDDREALSLVVWEELKPREAAAVLGMTPGRFSVRLHRAKKRLRQEMKGAGHKQGEASDQGTELRADAPTRDIRTETQ